MKEVKEITEVLMDCITSDKRWLANLDSSVNHHQKEIKATQRAVEFLAEELKALKREVSLTWLDKLKRKLFPPKPKLPISFTTKLCNMLRDS